MMIYEVLELRNPSGKFQFVGRSDETDYIEVIGDEYDTREAAYNCPKVAEWRKAKGNAA